MQTTRRARANKRCLLDTLPEPIHLSDLVLSREHCFFPSLYNPPRQGRPISESGHSRHFGSSADYFRLIVLKKSFWGAVQNFSGPLMPFARGNMRDHIVSRKNDHGPWYGRYAVLQWWSRLKISFCEIFGVSAFDFCNNSCQKRSFDRLVRTAHRAIRATPLSEDPQ